MLRQRRTSREQGLRGIEQYEAGCGLYHGDEFAAQRFIVFDHQNRDGRAAVHQWKAYCADTNIARSSAGKAEYVGRLVNTP
ncbi:hypothetical protein D3C83_29860 [compost metagenome]